MAKYSGNIGVGKKIATVEKRNNKNAKAKPSIIELIAGDGLKDLALKFARIKKILKIKIKLSALKNICPPKVNLENRDIFREYSVRLR